jgi:hypothetical protein
MTAQFPTRRPRILNARSIGSSPAMLLLVLAVALVACQQPSGQATGDASPSPTVRPTPTPSAGPSDEPSPTPSPTTPVATPSPSAPSADAPIGPDDVVATTVESLFLRLSAGTDGEPIGFLELGTVGFVLAGPTEVDGIPWYLISGMGLPHASGCITTPPTEPMTCPGFRGWVAGANADGHPWLERTSGPDCADSPTIETISEAGFTLRLICWADGELTLRAYWPTIPDGAGLGGACQAEDLPAGWLLCQHINYIGLAANEAEGFTQRLTLSIDPDSGVTMPERGQWIEVTGHFDDPAASQCADAPTAGDLPEQSPESMVFNCRLQFVPTSVTPSR